MRLNGPYFPAFGDGETDKSRGTFVPTTHDRPGTKVLNLKRCDARIFIGAAQVKDWGAELAALMGMSAER